MIILRKKRFSEDNSSNNSESSGWIYYPSQYIAEPLDHGLDYLESSKIGELKPVKRKSRMIRGVTKWLKSKSKHRENSKKKK